MRAHFVRRTYSTARLTCCCWASATTSSYPPRALLAAWLRAVSARARGEFPRTPKTGPTRHTTPSASYRRRQERAPALSVGSLCRRPAVTANCILYLKCRTRSTTSAAPYKKNIMSPSFSKFTTKSHDSFDLVIMRTYRYHGRHRRCVMPATLLGSQRINRRALPTETRHAAERHLQRHSSLLVKQLAPHTAACLRRGRAAQQPHAHIQRTPLHHRITACVRCD